MDRRTSRPLIAKNHFSESAMTAGKKSQISYLRKMKYGDIKQNLCIDAKTNFIQYAISGRSNILKQLTISPLPYSFT